MMGRNNMSTLNDRDRENLTAYLDGELDAKSAQALEAKINLDPEARKEVEALKQAWGMLDYLPKAQPTTNFTHRTMERLSLEKMGLALQTGISTRRRALFWARTLGWTLAILVALGAGIGLGQMFFPKVQKAIEADEPIVITVRPNSDQEWMKDQPKALRDQYALLENDAKIGFVVKLRLEERQRRQEWLIAGRFWKELEKGIPLPGRLADFPIDVKTYVTEYLRPLLAKEEEERLEKAQGQWPLYPMTLVELADKHPPALRGPKGPQDIR